MNMHKSGLGMLRCALRSTLLWKCDISIMKQVPLCYNIKSLASTQLGSDKNKALASKSIRYYSHSAPDAAKESTAATETTEVQQNEAEKNSLLVYLAGCKSPTEVLDELNRYSIHVNQIWKIFFIMWECIEEMTSEQKQMEFKLMIEHPEFSALCERLMIEAGAMKHHALGRTLHAAVNLGVSQDSRVVQTLLRVAQEHLNQFDLDSLCMLSRALHDMTSSNAQTLRESLRLLLLKDDIPETSNVKTLTRLMQWVGKDSPLQLKNQLASKVFSLSSEFTSANHFYIFTGLANIDLNHTPLLDTCSKKLAENIHDYSFTQLLKVLRCCHEVDYRNYNLFSSISKHMALTIDMCTDQQVLKILQAFEKLFFRPVELLDVFAERIIQEPENLSVNELLMTILYRLHALNLSLRLENPSLPSSMSSLTKLNLPSMDINHRVDQEIRSLIREIVGRDAVQEAVVEQGVYFIDFVISLPVQEETPGFQTEGAGSSQCAQRIALITVRGNSFCYGTNHYRGPVVQKARHLEKLGYKTVLVPYNYFHLMPKAEKIEKLRPMIFST
ncbi:hypothetical protein DNTS_032263 [Danionella cerebrum]|uniref:RAP domain-containing protein n=1 Tax=Danionella cerebrum TaxID=2873325 RepID=A0A553RDE9_9TELE|nr:hypothetical protein DNTS_032263 [Danionella translucida]